MKVKLTKDVYLADQKEPVLRAGYIGEVQDRRSGDSIMYAMVMINGVWVMECNTEPYPEHRTVYKIGNAPVPPELKSAVFKGKVRMTKDFDDGRVLLRKGDEHSAEIANNGMLCYINGHAVPLTYVHVIPAEPAPLTKPTNPKDRAATSRLDLSLFPATARAYGALAMTEGDLKYGAYNYRDAGVCASVYYAAANRHLDDWFNGEECDQKTGVPHLANALACIAVLIDAHVCNKLNDDRPPVAPYRALLNEFEGKVKHLQSIFTNPPGRVSAKGQKQ